MIDEARILLPRLAGEDQAAEGKISFPSFIFKNYDEFLQNSQKLAKILPKPEGDKKAAEKIIKILNK